jgi:hypothetical protein
MKFRSLVQFLTCSIAITAAAIPSMAQVTVSSDSKSGTEIQIRNGNNYKWKSSSNGKEFSIELRGKIEVTDDDKDIKTITSDGYLEISKTVFGSKRTVIIEAIGNKVKKEYYEGRTLVSWDEKGRAWLGEILPEIVRSTGISAEARVNRYYKQGGTTAVLEEINRLENDMVRSMYANLLMKKPVQPSEYASIIRTISGKIDSDHYKTEFLKANATKFLQNKEATTAMLSATNGMDSDHYKTLIIKEALQGESATDESIAVVLQASSKMESDHYITEVLLSLLKQQNITDAVLTELITTTKSMESDHYKTVVLTKALTNNNLSKQSYQRLIESVDGVESDHYRTQIINSLLTKKLTDEVFLNITTLTSKMESDHYRTEVLTQLLKKQTANSNVFSSVLNITASMESDHYKTVILQTALAGNIPDAQVIELLKSLKGMESDHYLTEILLTAAPKVKAGSTPLKDAYRDAARSIDSETYYGKALRAID